MNPFYYPTNGDLVIVSTLVVIYPWFMFTLINKVFWDWWCCDGKQYPTYQDFMCLPRFLHACWLRVQEYCAPKKRAKAGHRRQ